MPMPTVLIADDTPLFIEVMQGFFSRTRLTLLTAVNGVEALRLAREQHPQLVILDLHMPEMDGTECCAAIKGDPALAATPVLMLHAEGREADHAACLAAGADAILTKPLERRSFLEGTFRFVPLIERRDQRRPHRATVVLVTPAGPVYTNSVDLSPGGLYVAASRQVRLNERLGVAFQPVGVAGEVIEGVGRVAWINQGPTRLKPALPEGFGVEFLELSDDSRALLDRILSIMP